MNIAEIIPLIYWDTQGYPTDEFLTAIENFKGDWNVLLAAIKPAWRYSDVGYWREEDGETRVLKEPLRRYHISTAGWSGNESIIEALQKNVIFWMMCWQQTNRGGHYIFEVTKDGTATI